MQILAKHLTMIIRVGLAGGVAGAINATLCFLGLPINFNRNYTVFKWHIIPAGFFHGAFLGLMPLLIFYYLVKGKNIFIKLINIPIAGYLGGWIAGIFIALSLGSEPSWKDIIWPIREGFNEKTLSAPFLFFGFASIGYYLSLLLLHEKKNLKQLSFISLIVYSGILGGFTGWQGSETSWSLEVWPVFLLHGSIWGSFMGLGTWLSTKELI